jgi:hypothetical protein
VRERRPSRLPWTLVAGSGLLALLLAWVLFGAYVPVKQRASRLEAELHGLYAREAELLKRVDELEQRLLDRFLREQ